MMKTNETKIWRDCAKKCYVNNEQKMKFRKEK